MLPPLPLHKFVQMGNAAGIGAKEVLISRRARETATRISREAKYIELTNSPKFSRYFAAALKFPP